MPVADALRKAFPNAKIDLLVNSRVWELVNDYPALDEVRKMDRVSVNAIKKLCKTKNYDLAIIVYPKFKIALGILLGGVKYRIGTGYRWYSFLFNFKHYQHRKHSLKHESTYNLDLLNAVNLYIDNKIELKIKVRNEHTQNLYSKIKMLKPADKYIVIHIPSLGSAKVWSDDNFIELLNLILNNVKNYYKIVLTGTRGDENQVKKIISNLPENNRVIDIFNLNLKELAALLSKASLFLGNSSGPIHIAAAVGTFVIGLYSPVKVESPLRWGPLTNKKKIFVPESDDNSRDVMNDIKPIEVYSFINEYISSSKI